MIRAVPSRSSASPAPTAAPASPAPAAGSAAPAVKPAYPPPPPTPTQEGPNGIRYDFNLGARILLPQRQEGEWLVRLSDIDTGNVLFESRNKGAMVASSKRYYVRFRIEIWDNDERIFEHDYDCRDKEVIILFPVGTLGDTMAWFPYAARFAEVHGCKLTCALSGLIIPMLKDQYPDINLVTHEELVESKLQERAYASYCLGLFFDDVACVWQPTDFRMVGLHRTAGYILGVDPTEAPTKVSIPDDPRPIEEPYVVVAVQSSSACKMWNNPMGWREVVTHLKEAGYRVVCIDQKAVYGSGLLYTHIPYGVEDQTGDRPLTERAHWIKHADLYIGLSSGLAWLAYAVGTPAVVISGFTHPTNEFATPYRVINWHACNSCWNDPALRFKHDDFMWCPRHKDTPRHFECTRLITGSQVNLTIDRALAAIKADKA